MSTTRAKPTLSLQDTLTGLALAALIVGGAGIAVMGVMVFV